jgi:hypothetical protein
LKIEKQFTALNESAYKPCWVACGVGDPPAHQNTMKLIDELWKPNIKYTSRESTGGHTWFNWRICLSEFAPVLFC